MSNSISMNRCALPPHSRSTFPQGLEHQYLSSLKVEQDSSSGAYGFAMQHTGEYPSTPYSAPAMSSCPSSSTSYDGFEFSRRSSTTSGYLSSTSQTFYSPMSNSSRMCATPTPLTSASEMSQFPRTPDFRDARAFDVHGPSRPQFNQLSIANMSYGACESTSLASAGFHGSMASTSPTYPMMPSGCIMDSNQDASNIDPNLWDAGNTSAAPLTGVGSQFYEQQNGLQQFRPAFQHLQHMQQQQHLQHPAASAVSDIAQATTSNERMGSYFLRSSSSSQLQNA